jgi:putative CocE/NonD family hydrolase
MTFAYDVLGPAPLDPAAEQIMVPMRDGVRLATDVYLPDGHGRVPAVLVRLPYDKCGRYTFMPALAPYFTERGYAFVVQDVRGKFRSEGETLAFTYEVEDGYDTIDWVARRSWCDGKVGMWGDSYYGYTQWAAVASEHPALKAIVPRVTSADLEVFCGWWGDQVLPLYGADYLAHYWLDQNIYDFQPDVTTRPLASLYDEPFAAIGRRARSLDLMVGRSGPEAVFRHPGRHPFDALKVPVLHSVGWFDNIAPYSFVDFEQLAARPGLEPLQYLVGDSTDHENYHLRLVPVGGDDDHDVDEAALARMIPVYTGPGLDFFDVFLKGRGDAASVPRAAWFLGNEDWHTSPGWPPPGARELRLYLGAPERAADGVEGGALLPAPDAGGVARWMHDPDDLVPSTCVNPFSSLREWSDERVVQGRGDVLTFSGEPAAEPLDLAGPVSAWLTLGSSCSSMHVHAKLCDVYPDGSAHMLVRGELLVREADYGRPVEVRMSHTAHRLLPGHSLRLSIASSDFPLYLWHPGTDEDPWLATEGRANEQRLTTGGGAPSYLRVTQV